jgi:hypothetical protein
MSKTVVVPVTFSVFPDLSGASMSSGNRYLFEESTGWELAGRHDFGGCRLGASTKGADASGDEESTMNPVQTSGRRAP